MRTLLSLAVVLVWAAQPAAAQNTDVRLIGEVEDVGAGFGVLGTSVVLQSGQVDLSNHTGERLDMVGTEVVGATPPTVIVDSVTPSLTRFRMIGDSRIGRTFGLRLEDPTALSYYTFVSLQEGFLPLDRLNPNVHGTLYLSTTGLFGVSAGPMTNEWSRDIAVPNDPSLVGLSLWFQSALNQGTGELFYGNPVVVQITS